MTKQLDLFRQVNSGGSSYQTAAYGRDSLVSLRFASLHDVIEVEQTPLIESVQNKHGNSGKTHVSGHLIRMMVKSASFGRIDEEARFHPFNCPFSLKYNCPKAFAIARKAASIEPNQFNSGQSLSDHQPGNIVSALTAIALITYVNVVYGTGLARSIPTMVFSVIPRI